jgi:hypothetical protein
MARGAKDRGAVQGGHGTTEACMHVNVTWTGSFVVEASSRGIHDRSRSIGYRVPLQFASLLSTVTPGPAAGQDVRDI